MTIYLPCIPDGPLRQSEVLEGVRSLRFDVTKLSLENLESRRPPAEWANTPWTIVLSPECDLEWDFNARHGHANSSTKSLNHVLLCELEDGTRIQRFIGGSTNWGRVKDNREERFHHIPRDEFGNGKVVNEFFIDFKSLCAIPTDYLYGIIELGIVVRHGILKPPWVQHLADRFTYFIGRVGLPDTEY